MFHLRIGEEEAAMKKVVRKLYIKRETLRSLAAGQLVLAGGGRRIPTLDCPSIGPNACELLTSRC